jgi:hypothetical protein
VFISLSNGNLFVLLTFLFTFFMLWVEFQCYRGAGAADAVAASAGVVVMVVSVVAAAAGISMKRNSTIRKRKLEDSLPIT